MTNDVRRRVSAEPAGGGASGVDEDRRWRALLTASFVLAPMIAFGAWGPVDRTGLPVRASGRPTTRVAHDRDAAAARQSVTWRRRWSIHVAAGAVVKQFDGLEPPGVIRLLRLTVRRGTRARLTADIQGVAGISIFAPRSTLPAETCHGAGSVDVCTQAVEACPMPPATWRFRLNKLEGPAGVVRLEFVVGPTST
jgi:hypothetical protein